MKEEDEYEVLFKDPEHAALFRAFSSFKRETERHLGKLDVKVYGVIAGLVASVAFVASRGFH